MFNLQGSEIIVILLIALVVLGPERLPDAVRRFMQTYNELKKMGTGFQSEIKSAFDEPMREMRNTANMVRDAADPSKLMAEAEAEQRLRDDAAQATPQGVIDPGYDVVATPGSPPPAPEPAPSPSLDAFPKGFVPTPAPPPPPPPPPGWIAGSVKPPADLSVPSESVVP
ncbi:MAG TPA: twin-arginine translocase TatA/TatE family subunit [Ilumatobacteraceae bacterium]|nr:twin-arginine translocase TatA/TatE family subunit [Ilumatobacteraceae bacterium]